MKTIFVDQSAATRLSVRTKDGVPVLLVTSPDAIDGQREYYVLVIDYNGKVEFRCRHVCWEREKRWSPIIMLWRQDKDIEVIAREQMETAKLNPGKWDLFALRAPGGEAGFYAVRKENGL